MDRAEAGEEVVALGGQGIGFDQGQAVAAAGGPERDAGIGCVEAQARDTEQGEGGHALARQRAEHHEARTGGDAREEESSTRHAAGDGRIGEGVELNARRRNATGPGAAQAGLGAGRKDEHVVVELRWGAGCVCGSRDDAALEIGAADAAKNLSDSRPRT